MKIGLISDLHFGVRKGNDLFLQNQLNFFRNTFIPELKSRNVTEIHILGDLMDNRNNINVKILSEVTNLFRNDFKDFNITILAGNHDIYYKTSVKTNSLSFLDILPNVNVVDEIQIDQKILEATGKKVLIVPWIVDEDDFVNRVNNKNIECDYCFGHFELNGFDLNRYVMSTGGLNPQVILNNYKRTFSGHYHKPSKKTFGDNFIQYLGCPYQLTRNDRDEDKGFYILDLEKDQYEFIINKGSLEFKQIKFPNKFTKKEVKGNIIDVIVDYDENYNEVNVQKYLRILDKYEPAMPATVKIENKMLDGTLEDVEHQSIEELLTEYVMSLQIASKEEILAEIINLYRGYK